MYINGIYRVLLGRENKMKVVYLGPTESHTLEHGKVYEVLSEEDGWYRIIDKSIKFDEYLCCKIENLTIKTGSALTKYAEKFRKSIN